MKKLLALTAIFGIFGCLVACSSNEPAEEAPKGEPPVQVEAPEGSKTPEQRAAEAMGQETDGG